MSFIKGRVVKDAEVKQFESGTQVVNFTVAVNESYKKKTGENVERVEYFNCRYWFDADMANVLKKGVPVEVSGWITTEGYMIGNDIKARLIMQVQSVKFPFVPKKKENGQTTAQQELVLEGHAICPFSSEDNGKHSAPMLPFVSFQSLGKLLA